MYETIIISVITVLVYGFGVFCGIAYSPKRDSKGKIEFKNKINIPA